MVVGDVTTGTEVLVIGAGPGGYVAAIRAAQRGLDTTLVERDAYGGACLNRGCIPSKALITATDLAHEAGNAESMGIHADPAVDFAKTVDWKDGIVDRLTSGVEKLCKANRVNLIEGEASFVDEHTVRVAHGGDGQGSESLSFEHAIIATGSRPIEIPGFAFSEDHIWTSADALAAESVPDRLAIVGGGYIGMELATVYAKLGAEVRVIEMLDDILGPYEDDIARVVRKRAEDLGIEFHFGEGATGWSEGADGGYLLHTEPVEEGADGDEDGTDGDEDGTDGDEDRETEDSDTDADVDDTDGGSTYAADKILVAVGRQPVTDTLDLERAGIETTDRGFIETDDRARTDVEHIHAVGDVAGEPMLAHVASVEGIVAAETIAGEPAALDRQAVPAAVFTDPEIGTVGMTESEAAEAGFDPVVGEMPFMGSGRALTTGHTDGFVRIVADDGTGFVLGGQIVGPEASELIAEVALAVEMGATLEDVTGTTHTHPTLSEAVMEAAENALGQAIHTLNR
ncbi:dihydrolipoyl dehydrogenase family protein [Halorubrum vacuolatum]|uniref:dihydrolipoyl dehydrogenase n=1 Tax=Halorubrum vacuolatum TaxID=63740 RepID=A0A238VV05_HALVU|nr:dihydrolipoyl dehydrogenase [Halorubrum vacuolatum]SNR38152.1 dihydrolipoamide dehydrogenase [Halorubrum vacuolatum]